MIFNKKVLLSNSYTSTILKWSNKQYYNINKININENILNINKYNYNINKNISSSKFFYAFVSGLTTSTIVKCDSSNNNKNENQVILYQYEPCPYCHKVKSVLDYYKIPYEIVEVNPIFKKETNFTTYNKVPIIKINEQVFVDSTNITNVIIKKIEENSIKSSRFEQDNELVQKKRNKKDILKEEKWRKWVDEKLIILMPPNIYRTIPEALDSFEYILVEGKFTTFERQMSKYVGAGVMYLIAKKSLKKYHIQDARESLHFELNLWMKEGVHNNKFCGGDHPNVADLATFGVLRSIIGLKTFNDIMTNTALASWFDRMEKTVGESSRTKNI